MTAMDLKQPFGITLRKNVCENTLDNQKSSVTEIKNYFTFTKILGIFLS